MNIQAFIQEIYPNHQLVQATGIDDIRSILNSESPICNMGWITDERGNKVAYILTLSGGASGFMLYCTPEVYDVAYAPILVSQMEQKIAQLEADKTELFVLVGRLVKVMESFGEGKKNPFAVPIEESIALLEKLNEN